MQIQLRHYQITKLNKKQQKISLTHWFDHVGQNLIGKTPPSEFQVITPKECTKKIRGYK